MLSEIQRIILKDALDTLKHINVAAKIVKGEIRKSEIIDLTLRIKDDIDTVMRMK